MTHRIQISLIIAVAALVSGCGNDDSKIQTYAAPKDPPAPQIASNGQAGPSQARQNATPPIVWTLPSGWKELPGGEMRYATIQVSAADPKAQLTVVPLPSEAAPVLPNVKRWAGQLKLSNVTEADLSKYVQQTQVSGEQAQLVDMTGSPETGNPPTRLLAAIIPHDGRAWFFTLKASEPLASAQKSNFEKFIHSIQFPVSAGPAAAGEPASHGADFATPDPHGGDSSQANQPSYRLVKWTTPEGWAEQPGSNSMRVTSFRVGPADQQTEVVVARIPQGQTGAFLDNINRWRGQVGLGPVTDMVPGGTSPISVGGSPGLLLSFTGPSQSGQPPKQMLVAMFVEGRDFWFVKLLGPEPVVAKQQNAFRQYVESLQLEPESSH